MDVLLMRFRRNNQDRFSCECFIKISTVIIRYSRMFSCELLKPGDGHPLSLISFASVCLGFSQDLQACHGYYENQNQGMF